MNIEKEINQATELAHKIGEALDGESMALVLTVPVSYTHLTLPTILRV